MGIGEPEFSLYIFDKIIFIRSDLERTGYMDPSNSRLRLERDPLFFVRALCAHGFDPALLDSSFQGKDEWTRMQRIRTLAEIPFDFPVFTETLFKYQELREKAKKLRILGMSYREIGRRLGVDYKVIKKATDL